MSEIDVSPNCLFEVALNSGRASLTCQFQRRKIRASVGQTISRYGSVERLAESVRLRNGYDSQQVGSGEGAV
jgi:hypothetical protein